MAGNVPVRVQVDLPIVNALLRLDLDEIRNQGRSSEVLRQFVEIAEGVHASLAKMDAEKREDVEQS